MKKECIQYYEQEARRYDSRRFSCTCGKMVDRTFKQAVYDHLRSSQLVLDAGTGTGRFAIFLAAKGKRVVAVDSSQNMLHVARDKAVGSGVQDNIAFVQADVQQLPFSNAVFDGICSIHVLVHFDSLDEAISEYSRVIKLKDGVIVFDLSHASIIKVYSLLERLRSSTPFSFPNYYHGLSTIRELLSKNGVQITAVRHIKKIPRPILHLLICRLGFSWLVPLYRTVEQLNFGVLRIIKAKRL